MTPVRRSCIDLPPVLYFTSRACRHLTPAEPKHPERDQRQPKGAATPSTNRSWTSDVRLSVRRGVVQC
jgi:hypothetical protein